MNIGRVAMGKKGTRILQTSALKKRICSGVLVHMRSSSLDYSLLFPSTSLAKSLWPVSAQPCRWYRSFLERISYSAQSSDSLSKRTWRSPTIRSFSCIWREALIQRAWLVGPSSTSSCWQPSWFGQFSLQDFCSTQEMSKRKKTLQSSITRLFSSKRETTTLVMDSKRISLGVFSTPSGSASDAYVS